MSGLALSLLCGFLPMLALAWILFALDPYEKEPKKLLGGVFIWGAVIAVAGALVLEVIAGESVLLLTGSKAAKVVLGSSLFAPVFEEILKGAAVALIFLRFRQEFDSILDGIVYAGITALGFAATEDALYYFAGYEKGGLGALTGMVLLRFVVFGWQHVFFTAFTGIGLAIARLDRRVLVKITAPLVGLSLAIFTHSLHNTILTFIRGLVGVAVAAVIAWSGWLIMVGFIIYLIYREKSWLVEYLRDEVALNTITQEQYTVACSFWKQSAARVAALGRARYRITDRFYQLCGELMHKKHQLDRLGEETGNSRMVSDLREELKSLSGLVLA